MKRCALFFGLLQLVTGCGELVVKPTVGGLTDGVSRVEQSVSGSRNIATLSFGGSTYQVPNFVGLIDLNGKPVCDASSIVFGETLGLQVTCNASGSLWFDSGTERSGPEVFRGMVAALRSAGLDVETTQDGVTITGDGADTSAVVAGGPVEAAGVDFLGDGTSVYDGPALDQVSRSFGDLVAVTDGGGTIASVPNVQGLADTANSMAADAGLSVSAAESGGRLYLVGPASEVEFLKASLSPEQQQTITLVTGPMASGAVEALAGAFPDLIVTHDADNGLLFVRGYGDQLQEASGSLSRFIQSPRQVRLDGVFAEFTQTKSFDAGLSAAFSSGGMSGSFGAVSDGSSVTFDGDVSATLSLLEEVGKVSVLARPSLTVLDGQSADFVSGDQVPVSGETVRDENGQTSTSIEYRDTGIVLRVHAIVLDDATVQIKVSIEVTSVRDVTGVGGNPVFSTRTVNTTLRVTDGQSVVISGLDQSDASSGSSGAPFLSRFGLLGNRQEGQQSTQLVFIVTPDVMGTSGATLRNNSNF